MDEFFAVEERKGSSDTTEEDRRKKKGKAFKNLSSQEEKLVEDILKFLHKKSIVNR